MVTESTRDTLRTLRLFAMAAAWEDQQAHAETSALAFDDRFGLLVDAEALARDNARLTRRLQEAKLKLGQACLEGIDFPSRRQLETSLVRQLASGRWITEHQNIAITGATGTGKTYIACALAQQACRLGYRALYRRLPRLYEELTLAHADGTYTRFLARLARIDVLVLDDWGLTPPRDADRRDLLEIVEDRYGSRSTILTSQIPADHWHDAFGDPALADAICDRLLHNTHRLVLQGPSRRKEAAPTSL